MVHRVNAMRYRSVYPKLEIQPDVEMWWQIMKNRDLGRCSV